MGKIGKFFFNLLLGTSFVTIISCGSTNNFPINSLILNSNIPPLNNKIRTTGKIDNRLIINLNNNFTKQGIEEYIRKHNVKLIKTIVPLKSIVVESNKPIEQREFGIFKTAGVGEIEHDIIVSIPPVEEVLSIQENPLEPFYPKDPTELTKDPASKYQYGLRQINALQAWKKSTGKGIKVAVVDTGVDLNHPDLKDNLIEGYNSIDPDKPPRDDHYHGTHVAGIIGAVANNNIGIAGVAPDSKIMPIKVMDNDGKGNASDIAQGIVWAVDHGADVINLSIGSRYKSDIQLKAINYALKKNVVVVSSMGNDGTEVKFYPAAFNEIPGLKDVIAVGSIEPKKSKSSFSNYGNWISVTAPGSYIASTMPSYNTRVIQEQGLVLKYGVLSGTSMSAPFVSGAAALILSQKNNIKPSLVKSILQNSAEDLGDKGFDKYYGHGLINISKAIKSE